MAKEHEKYKSYRKKLEVVKPQLEDLEPVKYGKAHSSEVRKSVYNEGLDLSTKQRKYANKEAAARHGFDHKYPCAFEDLDAKKKHIHQAKGLTESAQRAARIQTHCKKSIQRFGYEY
ncbi:uncharacterized protein BDV14DRAFT_152104 [Aspergillus stella-maris]|uniref:uncharacterized protein n=1 Tax=Aspergillus stella-maris TaxID=1810926 RepID=UPI003CCC9965